MSKINAQEIRADVNRRVLDELSKAVAAIESGKGWERPWTVNATPQFNMNGGRVYRGLNQLLLSWAGYSDPRWVTFKKATELGGKVRKGEKSTLVTLWKRIVVKDTDAPDGKKVIPILRYFRVFNVEQVDWPEGVLKPLEVDEPSEGYDPIAAADEVIENYVNSAAITVFRGGDRAFYRPADHTITLPDDEQFKSAEGYYATAFHECAHSTHIECKRELGTSFGSDSYAKEELVAELAAAMLCANTGVQPNTENSAKYLKGWMTRIADDDNLFMSAAGQAQKAADTILGTTFEEPPSDVDPSEITDKEAVNA